MLVQIDPNLVLNHTAVESITKMTDNKVAIRLTSGSCHYVYKPMADVVSLFVEPIHRVLSETRV